jgi:Fe-S oxidoreductase
MFQDTNLKLDIKLDREELKVLAKALKDYQAKGKTKEQFEEEYGCKLILDNCNYGIKGVSFRNDSNKTAFILKYKL